MRCIIATSAGGLVALAFAGGAVLAQQPPEKLPISTTGRAFLMPAEVGAKDTELERKLKERHNAAVKLLEARVQEYKKGIRDIGPVFEAARLAADAKVALATDAKARIAVLEQVLEVTKTVEEHLRQQVERGF